MQQHAQSVFGVLMTAKLKVDGTSACDVCMGKIHQPEQENYDASTGGRKNPKRKSHH